MRLRRRGLLPINALDLNMRIISYNCHGLRVGDSVGDRARRTVVDKLMQNCDILCLKETFLSKQDLGNLTLLMTIFTVLAHPQPDLTMGMVRGRISGGVATLWHKKLDSVINIIKVDVDWCFGVRVSCSSKELIILNVYAPYECHQNEDEYLSRLAFIGSFINGNNSASVFVVGDLNADLTDNWSMFAKHMLHFCLMIILRYQVKCCYLRTVIPI